jgi:hypothetical protein
MLRQLGTIALVVAFALMVVFIQAYGVSSVVTWYSVLRDSTERVARLEGQIAFLKQEQEILAPGTTDDQRMTALYKSLEIDAVEDNLRDEYVSHSIARRKLTMRITEYLMLACPVSLWLGVWSFKTARRRYHCAPSWREPGAPV